MTRDIYFALSFFEQRKHGMGEFRESKTVKNNENTSSLDYFYSDGSKLLQVRRVLIPAISYFLLLYYLP